MWIAVLVSNIGTWMQTVGAQWLVVHLPHAAILVSLVAAADYLPDLLFGLVGGVLADIFDRRRLLIAVQFGLCLVGLALTVLTYLGQMPPALLLGFTFVIGSSSAFSNPAYQSLVPELVPRSQLRAASALGSININLARLVGPALAGLVIARFGVAAVFGLNAAAFLFFGIVAAMWQPRIATTRELPERFLSAMRAGGRYIRNAPVVRRVLLRATLFLIPASALWGLLPLIASQRLQLGAAGYGLLLGALGAGAVGGAFFLPRVRSSMSDNTLTLWASGVYALALLLLVVTPNPVVAGVVLVGAGAAWMAVLSNTNAYLQLFLPAWVRARGLSVYQMVLFGSQAFGSLLWGFVAEPFGVVPAFIIAALVLLAGIVSVRWWPIIETAGMDRSTSAYWPEPQLAFEPPVQGRPVLVQVVYTIASEKERPFIQAMKQVRLSRRRTGATDWSLHRDGERPHTFVELYTVPSWDEHLRQHRQRQTGVDRRLEEEADAFSDPPPRVSHLLPAALETD
jgi:MFS family permease